MQQLIGELDDEVAELTDRRMATLVTHYLEDASEGMRRLTRTRSARSIEWLGSAWKWVAKSPDAADWNAIMKAQNDVIANTEQQIRVNTRLFDSTHESVQQINKVVERVDTIDGDLHATASTLHRAIILANQVGEIIRACQLSKTGTVNSNLLEEVETILSEVNYLSYQNTIETIEFSRPSVMTNGTMLLYILAFPKVTAESYRFMHLYSTISEGKQVMLKLVNKLVINPDETYTVLGDCLFFKKRTSSY